MRAFARAGLGLGLAAALVLTAPALAQPQGADPKLMRDLATANRILVDQGVIDVRGHVSVRDPRDPNRFFIARSMAPGLVTPADIQLYDLDGKLVGGDVAAPAYTERFIHARIYKARPDVNSVVHAHTPSLIAFSQSGVPLRAVSISGAFIGNAGVPVHTTGPAGESVVTIPAGDALAKALGANGAVMMRGHGVVVVGASMATAVGRSVGLDLNAKELAAILSMNARPTYLTLPSDAAAAPGDFAREWSWWASRLKD
jgi:HCOMODA/2-hydroxy-3-carboxy-muconic semialdehyde decarboxylase